MAEKHLTLALKEIESGKIANCYYLIGREKLFHDQLIRAITEKLLPDRASRDLNLTILYGTENSQQEMLSAAFSYPMLAQWKLVVVRSFDKLKLADAEALIKYLEHPQQTTCLVLSAEEAGRSAVYKKLQQRAVTIPCKPIPDYKLSDWIRDEVKARERSIEPQAVQMLIDHVGSSLLNLKQELDKILDYKTDGSNITLADIEEVTGISGEANIFALQKALAVRQLERSLTIARRLMESGFDVNAINSVLFAFFRKVLIAASLRRRGKSQRQIMADMHLREFQAKEIFKAVERFNYRQCWAIIRLLQRMDIQSKTSTVTPRHALETLVYKICRI